MAADHLGGTKRVEAVDALLAGQLVVTELMANPGPGCDEVADQYIELLYLGPDGGDLRGLVVLYELGSAELTGSVPVDNGDLVLLAAEAVSPCYGTAGYALPLEIGATVGALWLSTPSDTQLDAVDMTGWAIPDGTALQLSPGAMSASENDLESNWCLSTAPLGASGDLGTPGQPNTGC